MVASHCELLVYIPSLSGFCQVFLLQQRGILWVDQGECHENQQSPVFP